jgi:hypothetical protein
MLGFGTLGTPQRPEHIRQDLLTLDFNGLLTFHFLHITE